MANFIGQSGRNIVGDGWTIFINPYAQACDPSNCRDITHLDPTKGLYPYSFGHLVVPYSNFTITSFIAGIPIEVHVNDKFFQNNIRNIPQCSVMTIIGTRVIVKNIHFIYDGRCAQQTIDQDGIVPIDYMYRIPVRVQNKAIGVSRFHNLSCSDCFTPLAIIPLALDAANSVATVDTTGAVVINVTSATTQLWAGRPLAFLCGACIGGLTIDIITSQVIWWTSQMLPVGTFSLFNVSTIFQPVVQISTPATLHSCGASQSSINTMIILLIVAIVLIGVFGILFGVFAIHEKLIKRAKQQ